MLIQSFIHFIPENRFTVPILWDKKLHTIVNNESSEIIRIFNTAFNEFLPAEKAEITYYPEALRKEIDEINEWVYPTINSKTLPIIYILVANTLDISDGVYRSGFATTQEAYEQAVRALFDSLDKTEKILAGKDYLVGNRLTEADIRLFVTIVSNSDFEESQLTFSPQIRFDPVYVGHFKCNIRTIRDGYPAIHKSVLFVHDTLIAA